MFLFTGNDSFLIHIELQRWIDGFEKKYGSDAIVRLDVNEHSVDEIMVQCTDQGFFLEKKMVVIRGIPYPPKSSPKVMECADMLIDRFVSILESPDITIVFVGPKADKRTRCFKVASSLATNISLFDEKKGSALVSLIDKWTQSSLSSSQKDMIIQTTGGDTGRLYQECAKRMVAKNYSLSFDSIIYRDVHNSVFDFLDSLGKGRLIALDQWNGLRTQTMGSTSKLQLLIGGLLRGCKTLLMAVEGYTKGMDSKKLGAETGLHPFVTSKLLSRLRSSSLSFSCVFSVYQSLMDCDYRLKRGLVSEADFWALGRANFSLLIAS